MASASSSITNLKPFLQDKRDREGGASLNFSGCSAKGFCLKAKLVMCAGLQSHLKMVLVLAKLRMGPRTTSMPLSSDALSCKKKKRKKSSRHRKRCHPFLWSVKTAQCQKERGGFIAYLQNHGVKLFVLIQLLGAGQDGGGLACAWGAVEQEVGKLLLVDKPLDWRDGAALEKQKSSNYEALSHKWCWITDGSFEVLLLRKCKTNDWQHQHDANWGKRKSHEYKFVCLVLDTLTRCCADRKIRTKPNHEVYITFKHFKWET